MGNKDTVGLKVHQLLAEHQQNVENGLWSFFKEIEEAEGLILASDMAARGRKEIMLADNLVIFYWDYKPVLVWSNHPLDMRHNIDTPFDFAPGEPSPCSIKMAPFQKPVKVQDLPRDFLIKYNLMEAMHGKQKPRT